MRARIITPALFLIGSLAACGGNTKVDTFGDGGGGAGASGGSGGSGGQGAGTTTTTTAGGNGGGSSFDDCTGAGQCVLVSETCCGVCGMPTIDDMVAIHADNVDAHNALVCAEPEPCPDCPSAANPNLFAYCEADSCVGADWTSHPLNECTVAEDCRLRWSVDCCECNAGDWDLVAVPIDAVSELESLVCEPGTGCPECMPTYPADAQPYCDGGHCAVAYLDSSSAS